MLAIVATGQRFPLGMVGLFGLDQGRQTGRLGYWVLGHARGRGLATAAARALIGWAFDRLDLQQVIIDREPSNPASAKVADKLRAVEAGARLVEYEGSEVELIRHVISSRVTDAADRGSMRHSRRLRRRTAGDDRFFVNGAVE